MGEAARRKAAGNTKPKGDKWKQSHGMTRKGEEWNLSRKMRVLVAMPAGKKTLKDQQQKVMMRMKNKHRNLIRR